MCLGVRQPWIGLFCVQSVILIIFSYTMSFHMHFVKGYNFI